MSRDCSPGRSPTPLYDMTLVGISTTGSEFPAGGLKRPDAALSRGRLGLFGSRLRQHRFVAVVTAAVLVAGACSSHPPSQPPRSIPHPVARSAVPTAGRVSATGPSTRPPSAVDATVSPGPTSAEATRRYLTGPGRPLLSLHREAAAVARHATVRGCAAVVTALDPLGTP